MGCERESVMKVLVKLRRDLARRLAQWPEARSVALEIVEIYKAELEELLAEEPTFKRW